MPLAFFQDRDRFVLVAVLSLSPNRNMLVAPDGRWLGGYVPAFLRSYPFALVPKQGTDQLVLCIDTDSGLVVDGSAAGEDFVGPDGNISPALKKVLDFLNALEGSRRATDVAMAALAAAGVIQPWPITLKTGEADRPIAGLYRIDEVALNALTDDVFLKLRKASALPIAYGKCYQWANLASSSIWRGCRRSCDRRRFRRCRRTSIASLSCRATTKSSFDKLVGASRWPMSLLTVGTSTWTN